MRFVDRSKIKRPDVLDGKELERAIPVFTDGGNREFTFRHYKDDGVKYALEQLFHGKCAYCEAYFAQSQPVDIEHYRPKSRVAGSKHGGYWWLAAEWDNLLPSCIDCNRRRKQSHPPLSEDLEEFFSQIDPNNPQNMGKLDHFPLRDNSVRAIFHMDAAKRHASLLDEGRLLLNPTQDNPDEHISFNTGHKDEYSLALPWGEDGEVSDIGLMSIQTYGLNRLGLVQARTRVLRDLEFLMEIYINLELLAQKTEARRTVKINTLNNGFASAAHAQETQDDIQFFDSITQAFRSLQTDIIEKITQMMAPHAPYSTLVKTWFEAQKKEMNVA
ncbi:MAG: hypothetical protein ABJN22_12095 [Litorimonas sp.]